MDAEKRLRKEGITIPLDHPARRMYQEEGPDIFVVHRRNAWGNRLLTVGLWVSLGTFLFGTLFTSNWSFAWKVLASLGVSGVVAAVIGAIFMITPLSFGDPDKALARLREDFDLSWESFLQLSTEQVRAAARKVLEEHARLHLSAESRHPGKPLAEERIMAGKLFELTYARYVHRLQLLPDEGYGRYYDAAARLLET